MNPNEDLVRYFDISVYSKIIFKDTEKVLKFIWVS